MARQLTAAQTAIFIRRALKQQFGRTHPDARFSVITTNKIVTVRWQDGPPAALVDFAVRRFRLRDDGQPDAVWVGKEYVYTGAQHVICERHFSPALLNVIGEQVAQQRGVAPPEVRSYPHDAGSAFFVLDWTARVEGGEAMSEVCWRTALAADSQEYELPLQQRASRETMNTILQWKEMRPELAPLFEEFRAMVLIDAGLLNRIRAERVRVMTGQYGDVSLDTCDMPGVNRLMLTFYRNRDPFFVSWICESDGSRGGLHGAYGTLGQIAQLIQTVMAHPEAVAGHMPHPDAVAAINASCEQRKRPRQEQ